jgi:hypothetical protein
MILLMMFVVGCRQSTSVNNYCLWGHPIYKTEAEVLSMSDSLAVQIDQHNEEYEIHCVQ